MMGTPCASKISLEIKIWKKLFFFSKWLTVANSFFQIRSPLSSNYLALIAVGSSEQEVGGKLSKTVDMPCLLFLFSVWLCRQILYSIYFCIIEKNVICIAHNSSFPRNFFAQLTSFMSNVTSKMSLLYKIGTVYSGFKNFPVFKYEIFSMLLDVDFLFSFPANNFLKFFFFC